MKKIQPVECIGWSGFWNDGTIGWRTSTFIAGRSRRGVLRPETMDDSQRYAGDGGVKFVRVHITVTPIKDRRGRYITRRSKERPS